MHTHSCVLPIMFRKEEMQNISWPCDLRIPTVMATRLSQNAQQKRPLQKAVRKTILATAAWFSP